MRAGSFRAWPLIWVPWVGVACSNVLGISDYEIDPRLDPESRAPFPEIVGGNGGAPEEPSGGGADRAGEGGMAWAGSHPAEASAGETGAAGEPQVSRGCQSDAECDDTIDCTLDSCTAGGECEHRANPSRCDSSNCEVCTLGIGCVAGPKTLVQLLADPRFDDARSGWKQDGGTLIVEDSRALSSPNLVQLGPAAADATETRYGDLYQRVVMPKGIAALSLTLDFQFAPGVRQPPDEEYALAALYLRNTFTPFIAFHQFAGDAPAQPTWKRATYKASPADVARLADKDFTFDLVAHSFDGVYRFDNLQLDAIVCE